MFDTWEVVEEIVAKADEQETKRITTAQIGKELHDAGLNNARNVQAVRRSLVELGYQVGV